MGGLGIAITGLTDTCPVKAFLLLRDRDRQNFNHPLDHLYLLVGIITAFVCAIDTRFKLFNL